MAVSDILKPEVCDAARRSNHVHAESRSVNVEDSPLSCAHCVALCTAHHIEPNRTGRPLLHLYFYLSLPLPTVGTPATI